MVFLVPDNSCKNTTSDNSSVQKNRPKRKQTLLKIHLVHKKLPLSPLASSHAPSSSFSAPLFSLSGYLWRSIWTFSPIASSSFKCWMVKCRGSQCQFFKHTQIDHCVVLKTGWCLVRLSNTSELTLKSLSLAEWPNQPIECLVLILRCCSETVQ